MSGVDKHLLCHIVFLHPEKGRRPGGRSPCGWCLVVARSDAPTEVRSAQSAPAQTVSNSARLIAVLLRGGMPPPFKARCTFGITDKLLTLRPSRPDPGLTRQFVPAKILRSAKLIRANPMRNKARSGNHSGFAASNTMLKSTPEVAKGSRTAASRISPSSRSRCDAAGTVLPSPPRSSLCAGASCCRSAYARMLPRIL